MPLLSDHAPLLFDLEIKHNMPIEQAVNPLKPAPPKFIWTEESVENYINALKSDEVTHKFERLISQNLEDTNLFVEKLTKILIETADNAHVKRLKIRKGGSENNPPWFDGKCSEAERKIRLLGRKIQKQPKNFSLRTELTNAKRFLKNLVRKNKREFKHNLLEQMKLNRKDGKIFWKLLDKMEQKEDDTIFKANISAEKWVTYFKSIFHDPSKSSKLPQNNAEIGPLDFEISKEELEACAYILRNGKSPGYDSISYEVI